MQKVLIVDDDAPMVAMISAAFEEELDVQLFKAYDGNMAVELAKMSPPDLVVLDVTLPGQDGISVLRSLKADRRTADAKVIVMTGLATNAGAEGIALQMGADAFVKKPFSPFDLVDKACALLKVEQVA